ncbi:MAG: N-acetylglucosamine-6-phosphate deacetylase [Acidobacteria bacterium]|nr:N-acetylglucosamine-6-phosphate deacetylase [Acidobacteriota bacterium]
MSKGSLLAIDAGALFTPVKKFSPARLIVDGRSIAEVGSPETVRIPAGAERLDASRFIVTPGFIDPHIHGCGGVDVMDSSYDSLNAISRFIASRGTTAFLPTTVSSPPAVLTGAVEKLGGLMSNSFGGARPLGIHMEGPFISPAKRGTHAAENLHAPDAALLEGWIRASNDSVRLLTVAPELDGIDSVLRVAKDFGVTVAMGHSNASFDEAKTAADRGVCYAVHTFNAMRGFAHRDPGIVGAVLTDDRVFAEIIADGIHVARPVVGLFARAKGKTRILLATDSTAATGMADGRYVLGTGSVQVVDGVCRDAEGRLAGSTLTQDAAFRNFVEWTGLPFEEALPGLTLNPARALQLDGKGVLEPGADADITIMDRSFRVIATFVGGRLVWTS